MPKNFKRRHIIETDFEIVLRNILFEYEHDRICNSAGDSRKGCALHKKIKSVLNPPGGRFHESDPLTAEQFDDLEREFRKQVRLNYRDELEAGAAKGRQLGDNRLLRAALALTGLEYLSPHHLSAAQSDRLVEFFFAVITQQNELHDD